jgi:hypothetical protein
MHFVPIPTTQEALRKTRHLWLPLLPRIADRSDETIDELIDLVISGRMQIAIIWDGEKARALLGMQYRRAGRELIGEVHWATGFGVKNWQHLLPELERYMKEHQGCTIIKPICRPGWRPLLKAHGYKQTHVMMEKPL